MSSCTQIDAVKGGEISNQAQKDVLEVGHKQLGLN